MRSKKLLSLFLVLCMLVPIIPAWATDSEATETASNITYIVNHDFDDAADLAAWTKGAVKDDTQTVFDLTTTTVGEGDDAASALAFTATKIPVGNYLCTQPTAYLDFDDIEFTSGNKIIIETRVMQTGNADGNAFTYLKYNRPNSAEIASSYTDAEGNTIYAHSTASVNEVAEAAMHWWNMLRFNQGEIQSKSGKFVEAVTVNNWTDVKIVIDEGTQKYSVMTKTGDVEGSVESDTIATSSRWELQCFDSTATSFSYDSLDSLTLFMRDYAQTLYVDYFRVYEATPVYADAQILGGSTVEAGTNAEIQFINIFEDAEGTAATTVGSVPANAVTITNAAGTALATALAYDAEAQKISVAPTAGFAEGEVYTLTLNETALASVGLTCTGTTSFTVTGRGPRSKGLVINDDFATGTDGWNVGVSASGYEAQIATADDEGATDGKALKITFPEKGSIGNTATIGTVTKAVGNGIDFKDDKAIVLKTRIKNLDSSTDYQIRINRPNTLAQIDNEGAWLNYYVLRYNTGTSDGISLFKAFGASLGDGFSYPGADPFIYSKWNGTDYSGVDFTNKWVTYTLKFVPSEQTFYTTMTYTGDDGNEVTVFTERSEGKMLAQSQAYEKEYGVGSYDTTNPPYFKSFDRLTFAGYYAGDVLVDYVQVYEEDAFATATMSKTQYKKGEAPAIVFTTGMDVTEIPEGAVTIEGVEATQSFDADTKTLSLTPSSALKAGSTYTVKLDAEKLEEAGMFYTGAETLKFSYIGDYIIYDTFDIEGDTGSWELGYFGSTSGVTASFGQTSLTENDSTVGVLMLSTNGATGTSDTNAPNVISDFDDVDFVSGEKIIIETRFKHLGNQDETTSSGWTYLNFNRPNNATDLTSNSKNYMGTHGGALFAATDSGLRYKTGAYQLEGYNTTTNDAGKWINAKIVMDGATGTYGSYTLTTWFDGDEANAVTNTGTLQENGSIYYAPEAYDAESEDNQKKHTELRSLTYTLRNYANTLYVDEIKAYTTFDAYAEILGGTTVEAGKNAEIKFMADRDIDSIPAGAVTIDGAAAAQTYDAATKTVSVKPADAEFVSGQTYTIALDTEKLAAVGITYTGTTSFTVKGRGERSTGLVINDQFNNSTSEWVVGEATEGYQAVTDFVDVGDTTGNKALKVTMKTKTNAAGGANKVPNLTRTVGNGIEFSADKNIIVKTKMKLSSAMINSEGTANESKFQLKMNTVDYSKEIDYHATGWMTYALLKINPATGVNYASSISKHTNGAWYTNEKTISGTSSSAIADKWVTYTLKLNTAADTLGITAEIEGVDTPVTATAKLNTTTTAMETEYGAGTTKTAFDALDTLSFGIWDNANTDSIAYIDYIQVYEEDAVASVEVKDTIRYDEAFKITLDTEKELTSVDGIISVEGVEATQSFDAETKTITVAPAESLTVGNTYTVKVNSDAFEQLGILYEGEESFEVKVRDEVIIDDDFNTNLGNWKEGVRVEEDGQTVTVEQTTYDGEGVMHLGATAAPGFGGGQEPNVVNEFADIDFNSDRKIIIETRFKSTGGVNSDSTNGGLAWLQINRPNILEAAKGHGSGDWNWAGFRGGVLFESGKWYSTSNGVTTTYEGTAYKHNSYGSTVYEDLGIGDWINAKIVIDGTAGKYGTYTITTWADNNEANAATATGTLQEYKPAMYDYEGFVKNGSTEHTRHYSLRELTFTLQKFSNDLYVDKIKVYEQDSFDVAAIMVNGQTVEAGQSAELLFTANKEISTIPAGAVKVDGENAAYVSFADSKLSFKPASGEFAEGTTYAVTVDAEVLEALGMIYTGTTEFTVTGRGARETGAFEYDFADENHGWTVGASADGYLASIDVVEDSGAEDGSALLIDFPARGTSGDSQYGNVTAKFGNGIEFKDTEKVVIETRVKKASADGHFAIKLNRPDSVDQLFEDVAWPSQYALLINHTGTTGIQISQGIYPDMSAGATYNCPRLLTLSGTEAAPADKWITYKITLDYKTKKIYTTLTYTGDDGEEVTLVDYDSQGQMMAARWDLNAIHGEGAFDILEDKYYDALERLTFTSTNDCDIYVDYVNVYTTTSVDESISAKLTSDGTNEIASLKKDDTVKPVFVLQPKDGAETTYYAISAVYVDGKLSDTHIKKITTTGESYTDETGYTIEQDTGVVVKAFVWSESFVPICEAAVAESTAYAVYVRTSGSDSNTGDSTSPVATLGEALSRVYAATDAGEAEAAVIYVGEGNYKVDETILIPKTASIPDGGLVIKNETSNKPVFVGGNTYTGDMATLVTDETVLAKVPSAAQGKLYQLELGIDAPGLSYYGETSYSIKNAVMGLGLETDLTNITSEAAFDGKLMTIARWPNEGYSKTTSINDSPYAAKADFASMTQAEVEAAKSDDLIAKAKTGITFGVDTSKDISKWADADDALLFGYWLYDWATQTMPLGSVSDNTVTTKYASWYGGKSGAKYYIFNLLEELDTAGEYYIDRSPAGNDVLYFYSETAPTAENKITLSLLDESSPMLKVTTENDAVVIDGLVFEGSRGTGIALSGAIGATVQNCELRNLGGYALTMYSKDCVAQNNYIHDTNGGIVVNHNNQEYSEQLTASNNLVYNNEIKNYQRLNKVYIDGILIGGVKNKISYNKIHDSSHLAVRMTGHLNEFSYNEIYDVLKETGDAGAIYMGRSWSSRGNVIKSNYIHDLKTDSDDTSGIAGIYADDHYAGIEISGNVFENITGKGVMTNRGREQTITNNLFINCSGYGVVVGGPNYNDGKTTADYTTQKTSLDTISTYFNNEYWQTAFPELCVYGLSVGTDWAAQQRMIVTKNVAIGGSGLKVSAYAATYTDSTTYNNKEGYLSSDVSNNAGTVTAAVLGTDSESGNAYTAASLSADTYAGVVANPALATSGWASELGVAGFESIDWANMRHDG